MTAVAIVHLAGYQIDLTDKHRDKHILLIVPGEVCIQLVSYLLWRKLALRLYPEQVSGNSHEQGCRDAFSGHVPDHKAEVILIDLEIIIKVPADFLCRCHTRVKVKFRTLREGTYEDGLYEWCVSSILTLDALEEDFANFHVRFLLELSGALGFRPTFADVVPFAGENAPLLKPFLESGFSEAMLIPLSGQQRSDLCDTLLRYLEFHTDQPINIRSLSVLRELYR